MGTVVGEAAVASGAAKGAGAAAAGTAGTAAAAGTAAGVGAGLTAAELAGAGLWAAEMGSAAGAAGAIGGTAGALTAANAVGGGAASGASGALDAFIAGNELAWEINVAPEIAGTSIPAAGLGAAAGGGGAAESGGLLSAKTKEKLVDMAAQAAVGQAIGTLLSPGRGTAPKASKPTAMPKAPGAREKALAEREIMRKRTMGRNYTETLADKVG